MNPKKHTICVDAALLRSTVILSMATAFGLWTGGCRPIRIHHPPKAGKPAATVKFRIGHQYRPRGYLPFGAQFTSQPILSSLLTIDGRSLPYRPIQGGVTATWTRVKPGWRTFAIQSSYSQRYSVQVRQVYYETRYKPCMKYQCSTQYFMGHSKYRCGYKSSTCPKQVRRERLVWQTRTRYLGGCSAHLTVAMYDGATYLLTYSFLAPRTCQLICHRQVFHPDRSFRLIPCRYVKK